MKLIVRTYFQTCCLKNSVRENRAYSKPQGNKEEIVYWCLGKQLNSNYVYRIKE